MSSPSRRLPLPACEPNQNQQNRLRRYVGLLAVAGAMVAVGCGRIKKAVVPQQVYVTAKQAYLRDRVAAVSNRTGEVHNGEKLTVVGHQRRFLQVRTPSGTVGWIEERLTADQAVADGFEALKAQNDKDPVISQAVTRDEVYMHIAPGRETTRFYRLAENQSISLLKRASIAKPLPPGYNAATPATPPAGKLPVRQSGRAARLEAAAAAEQTPTAPAAPSMEDWWLVRTRDGATGWVYSHMIDNIVPDALARYSEGAHMVGAYELTRVDDPESGIMNNGQPVTSVPEYVAVLAPPKSGLPYDFNQVRVFIWNAKKHRYETAFRERNIAGYLPVRVARIKDPNPRDPHFAGELPSFTLRVLPEGVPVPTPNPKTGLIEPQRTVADTLVLEGNLCRRVLPPNTAAPQFAHPDPEPEKKARGRAHR